MDRPDTIEQWRASLYVTIDRLKSIHTEQFFDEQSLQYDPECAALHWIGGTFTKDFEHWKSLMSSLHNRKLPLDPKMIDSLTPTETYYRLAEHIANERFMDGILVEVFESGSLVAALEKILFNLDSFQMAKD